MGLFSDTTTAEIITNANDVFGYVFSEKQAQECLDRLNRLDMKSLGADEEKLVQNINACYEATELGLPVPPNIV